MSQQVPPQPDRQRRRSFGSFLLFLAVLMAVLFAFGDHSFQPQAELSQDQFEWALYTGQVDKQEFKGANLIEGSLRDGRAFKVSFTNLADRESLYQQLKAVPSYKLVSTDHLQQALAEGWYQPETARIVTAYQEPIEQRDGAMEDQPAAVTTIEASQEDRLFLNVMARSVSSWETAHRSQPPFPLPENSGGLWLEVENLDDLGALSASLREAGAKLETKSFNISPGKGSTAGEANGLFTQLLFFWGPWILFFVVFMLFMRHMRSQGGAGGVMSFGRSKAQLFNKDDHISVTFDDVAGAEEAKSEVQEVVEFLKNPGRFTRVGGRIPRGILLVGSPGCGKTLLAKAIAGEAEVPFFSISGSDFVEMFVGVGASRVRDLFKQARENSPCIIFLDEIDAVGRRRGSGMGGGHDEREQTLNAILVEMDGFSTDEGIIVVAATNRPDVLDPALLRPGRFDREVTIELPDMVGREAILNVHIKHVKHDETVDLGVLARSTPGYSGADLAAIVNEAAIMAVLDKQDKVGMAHMEEAKDKVRYGRQKKSRKLEEDDRKITAVHEAGHAVVAAAISDVEDPHKITIIPRGRALGATFWIPEKESYHMQRKKMIGQLAVLFGGRIAEAEFCGDISAGASDDIKRATEMARAMVTELGMSETIGPINYSERQGSDFLGSELLSGKWHSEDTARLIDKEVELLLKTAYEQASELLKEHSAEVDRLTEALLHYETLNEEEIVKLRAGCSVTDLRPAPEPPEPVEQEVGQAAPETSASSDPEPDELAGDLPGEAGLSPA
ncbi:MAG: ATP-dependent zinc metalloprotease FtsH [Planctomycetota bacterium]|jgi:cell division protease FtsH|nr:ATP-dependent zinc metalloprotease FtsH [Planctomycetota bacterium]MDP6837703.1 ATP-dependent zinc metalloprotease FtsH [Planctomycetota bacterium]